MGRGFGLGGVGNVSIIPQDVSQPRETDGLNAAPRRPPSGTGKRPSRSKAQTPRHFAACPGEGEEGWGESPVRTLEARDQRQETSEADAKRTSGGKSFPPSSGVTCAQDCLILTLNSFEPWAT